MRIDIGEHGELVFREVFNGITFIGDSGDRIGICMRDSGFEFQYHGTWYEAKEGKIKEIGTIEPRLIADKFQEPEHRKDIEIGMNIYAAKGYKVKVSEKSAKNGYDSDKEQVADLLELDVEYTVDYTKVSQSSTRVYLEEFSEESFNSVNFIEVNPQSKRVDERHDNYHKWLY